MVVRVAGGRAEAPTRARARPSVGVLCVTAIAVVGAVLGLGAVYLLRGSPFPPNGLGGDEAFRAASVLRDAHSIIPVDFSYRGLPAFYPPLYFGVLGRVVALTGMPSYEALKLGTIVVATVVPFLGFALWRRVTADALTAAAIVMGSLALHEWYEPYSWLAVIAFVPWWTEFVVRLRAHEAPRTVDLRRIVIGACIGSLIFMTYYYFFFVGALELVAVIGISALGRRRGHGLPLVVTPESYWVLAGSAVGSAFYWLPLAVSMVSTGTVESLQNRYLVQSMIDMPAPFLSVSVEGMVMLAGLITIVLGARRSALLLSLGALLAAAYVWFVLGYIAILIDQPVLSFRTNMLIEAILGAAAGIGALAAVRWLRHRLSGAVVTGFIGFSAVLLVCTSLAGIPYLAEQRDASLPTGMVQAFDRATRGLGDDPVVLTDEATLLAVRPAHLFNVWNAHYSHPVGQFQDRSRFLARLAAERDPAVVAAALRHNRYDPVDVVMLDRSAHGLTYRDYQDNFPRGTRARTLTLHQEQFADRWFTTTVSTGRAVFVARGADPLPSLDLTQRSKLRRHFRGDLSDQV